MNAERLDIERTAEEDRGEGGDLSRRELLEILGGGVLASGLAGCVPASVQTTSESLSDPLYFSSTKALAQAIRDRVVSSEEVVTACLDRIDAVNGALNAVVQIDRTGALARAREADAALARGESWGALHGVPMTIKDSLDTAGMISTGGTQGRASFVPDRDATVVERLRGAGAVLMGKTNTPELTLSFETDNVVYGRTSNPYDVARTSGGSSGGAAAIVAAGGSPFDVGSDYGGSIRLPSHFCGIAGIKPSAGRVPRTGHIYPFGGILDSCQQLGPLARRVDDLSLILPLIMGPDWIDPAVEPLPWSNPDEVDISTLTVSFHTDNGIATPTPETVRTVEEVASALSTEVAALTEARPNGAEEAFDLGVPLFFWDGGAAVQRLLDEAGTTEYSAAVQGFLAAEPMTPTQLDASITRWFAWRSRMLSFLEPYDAIVCPVRATPALQHGTASGADEFPGFSYTYTYNLTGWPGAVVRAGTSPEGLPIGVQIVTKPGREDVALAVAKFVESATGGYQRPTI